MAQKVKTARKSTGRTRKTTETISKKTARFAVIEQLEKMGMARGIEISRELGLKPTTVGYVLYQLRLSGHAKRVRTGVYKLVRKPKDCHFWDDGISQEKVPVLKGSTMPDQILNLLADAPNGALSFRAIWKVTGFPRNVTGAVLSDLSRRKLIKRVRRGLYKIAK